MEVTKTILFVDDEVYSSHLFAEPLSDAGYRVLFARTVAEAKKIIEKEQMDLAIIDLMLPLGEELDLTESDLLSARGGFRSGQVLAAWILKRHPGLKFVGFSFSYDSEPALWFKEKGAGFLCKADMMPEDLLICVERLLNIAEPFSPKSFIVHGHDNAAKYELKNYLQNTLGFPEPVILHEQPSYGRTIIEKFEAEATGLNLIFVLLTPDDKIADPGSPNEQKRRARQNVIFELGYFLAKMGRKSGRIILLHKGPIELPSDISGLTYIDVSNGINASGEAIRKEISSLLNSVSKTQGANN